MNWIRWCDGFSSSLAVFLPGLTFKATRSEQSICKAWTEQIIFHSVSYEDEGKAYTYYPAWEQMQKKSSIFLATNIQRHILAQIGPNIVLSDDDGLTMPRMELLFPKFLQQGLRTRTEGLCVVTSWPVLAWPALAWSTEFLCPSFIIITMPPMAIKVSPWDSDGQHTKVSVSPRFKWQKHHWSLVSRRIHENMSTVAHQEYNYIYSGEQVRMIKGLSSF